jgi:hypothetical protein
MEASFVDNYLCPKCSADVEAEAKVCKSCGAVISAGDAPSSDSPAIKPDGSLRGLLHNRWAILGLLFLVMAALGIPVLWASRAFSTRTKILLTIAVSLYTILILWGFWLVMAWCITRIQDAMSQM